MSNRMKKTISLVAATAIAASLPTGAWAEETAGGGSSSMPGAAGVAQPQSGGSVVEAAIPREEAIGLARKAVNLPEAYTLQSASFYTEVLAAGKRNVWNLSFVWKVNGKQRGNVNVRLDADKGGLLGYSAFVDDPSRKPAYPPKVDREAAREEALALIAAVGKPYAEQLRLNETYGLELKPPLNGEVRHRLRFNRVVNDIPYMDNYIDVEFDGDGRLLQYDVRWDETLRFENVSPGISEAKALERFKAEASPELIYWLPYDAPEGKAGKPALAYRLDPFMLDAATGQRWSPTEPGPAANTTVPVSERPLGAAPQAVQPITAERAAEAVARAFPLPAGAKLVDSSYSEYAASGRGQSGSYWNLRWTVEEKGEERSTVWAAVDGSTGAIRSYSAYWAEEKSGGASVSYEQAQARAVDTVKKLLPHLASQLYLQEQDRSRYEGKTPEEIGRYSFRFQRRAHGALVEAEGVSVSVSATTGQVLDYYGEAGYVELPADAPAVIGRERAADRWLEDYYQIELTYVVPNVWNGEPIPIEKYNVLVAAGEIRPGETTAGEAKLVYRLAARPLESPVLLEATGGEWVERQTGEPTSLDRPQATDIDGHWARRELELMVAYRALDLQDGRVRPNDIVTRGELIKMLVLAMNSGRPVPMPGYSSIAKASFDDVGAGSAFFAYVEQAVAQNLVDVGDGSFNPEGRVSREEMAELIVRALGYNTLAERDELFHISFADAAATERKGQAAIVVGLGIMSLQNGRFQPDRQVTRAEAAAAFFRFLRVREELREAPLRD